MVGPTKHRTPVASPLHQHRKEECNTTLPDTSPIVEVAQASQHEAEFSRLQAALGLMKKPIAEGSRNFKYGEYLAALEADKPTGLERKSNTHITSMEVAVRRNAAGAITSVDVVVARFCMLYLANVPPKDFVTTIQSTNNTKHYSRGGKTAMSEEELGYVRYHIQSMVHPCTSLNNNIVWGVHEHAGHLKCFSPTPLIFILSDKEAAMRDLRSLGCDIEKDICSRDIYDLRELDATYLARREAKGRAPTTGGLPTEITRSKRLSTLDEILKSRGCFSSNGEAGTPALNILQAAAKMATDDATTAGWARVKEEIDGGAFNQPQTFATADEADLYLLELHLARTRPVTKQTLDLLLEHEKARFRELPTMLRVAFSVNRAQEYNLTSYLAMFPRFEHVEKQNVYTMKLIRIASAEARLYRRVPPMTKHQYIAPMVVTGAMGTSDTSTSTQQRLPKGEELPLDLKKIGGNYRKVGRSISSRLVEFLESQMESWTETERAEVRGLYHTDEYMVHDFPVEYFKMNSNRSFVKLARKARQAGWTMDGQVARFFITAIEGRRKLRNWYDRLPEDDPRFEDNQNHEAWLQTMIEVVVALVGHQA